jgi:hypothetical protein
LSIIEEEYVSKIASYRYESDLIEARLILEDIIDIAMKEKETRSIAEPNRPGTPDDGGHHAIESWMKDAGK